MSATADRRTASMGGQTERERFDARHGFEDDRSLGRIVGDLVGHSQELMRGEIAIAKREMAENAKQVGGAAAIGVAAWPFALTTVVLLGFALARGLAEAIPLWAGYLIAAVVFGAIAAAFALIAKSRVKGASLAPTQGIESTKEDMAWIAAHKN